MYVKCTTRTIDNSIDRLSDYRASIATDKISSANSLRTDRPAMLKSCQFLLQDFSGLWLTAALEGILSS